MTDTYEAMFADEDDEQVPETELTDPAVVLLLRQLDDNRAMMTRLDIENKDLSEYLAEQYAGVKRMVWRDSQGRLRPFRVTPPSSTYEPGPAGLAWLKQNDPDTYRKVTKVVLDTRAYARLRKQGVISDKLHEAMLPRDEEGAPIAARHRRATVVLPAAQEPDEAPAPSEVADASA